MERETISGIKCDAKTCIHHAGDELCTAGCIKVSYCGDCGDTEASCETFRERN